MVDVFSVPVFFIIFRETLEASIIVSVLLAFLKQGIGNSSEDPKLYKRLRLQVWVGSAIGFGICLCIGGAFIGVFYGLGQDIWGNTEDIWEGVFALIATVLITLMGLAMLRVNKMQDKWRIKIAKAVLEEPVQNTDKKWYMFWKINYKNFSSKYAMAILPFITVLREGIEAIVFTGGVSLTQPATAFPLAVICGLAAGIGCGLIIYHGGHFLSIQIFLIASTCFLYLVAAGLFSKAIWYFENYKYSVLVGGDAAEEGNGPGSYDIHTSVWHVNCCNGETDNGWMIFNALFGWENSATYGSVIGYNVYWICIIVAVLTLIFLEKNMRLPFLPKAVQNKLIKKFNPVVDQSEIERSQAALRKHVNANNNGDALTVEETNHLSGEK